MCNRARILDPGSNYEVLDPMQAYEICNKPHISALVQKSNMIPGARSTCKGARGAAECYWLETID